MPASRGDHDIETVAKTEGPASRQWSRTAVALAILFGSLPLASKLFLGGWGFHSATGIAILCLFAAGYLYLIERKDRPPVPDPAAMLDAAIQYAAAGEAAKGLALLDEALRQSPKLWQARQYRGEIQLTQPGAAEYALQDFTEAIHLAPGEPHLYVLRSYVLSMLGRDSLAQADLEAANRLSGGSGTADHTRV